MMFNAQGELYVCEGAAYRIVAFDVRTKAKRVLCSQIDGQHFNEPNDLAIDFPGGFYFSDPNYQHRGQPTVMKQDVYYCSARGPGHARLDRSASSPTACCSRPTTTRSTWPTPAGR